jgi:hypothetical protein
MTLKPGTNVGREGGIYREIGPRGGAKDNFATVPENHRLPPTTTPGATWQPVKATPHGHRGPKAH